MGFFTNVDQTEVQEVLSNTYIVYALIMFVLYYLVNWIWRWIILVEKCRKKPTLPCEKIPNYHNTRLWTNKWCYNALSYICLIKHGIINLH